LKIFISYAREDQNLMEMARDACRKEGVDAEFDVDTRTSHSDDVLSSLKQKIQECGYFLVIVTPSAIRSPWVWFETGLVTQLKQHGDDKRIIPFIADPPPELPAFVRGYDAVYSVDELQKRIHANKPSRDLARSVAGVQEQSTEIITVLNQLKDVSNTAKRALSESISAMLDQQHANLSNLRGGEIVADAPALYKVYEVFMNAVTNRFRAVTAQDLRYWIDAESTPYLTQNKKLINDRKGSVERIFLLEAPGSNDNRSDDVPGWFPEQDLRAALRRQFDRGIRVRIAFFDRRLSFLAPASSHLDFGLFDDFAVSFFRTGEGRSYRISVNPSRCIEYANKYNQIVEECEIVPGKNHEDGEDVTLFGDETDFDRWVQSRFRTAT
jgi:hypothetical protein